MFLSAVECFLSVSNPSQIHGMIPVGGGQLGPKKLSLPLKGHHGHLVFFLKKCLIIHHWVILPVIFFEILDHPKSLFRM